MPAVEIIFWVAAGLLVYTHVGYPLVLAGSSTGCARRPQRRRPPFAELPRVSPDRRRPRRGGGDRGQGRERARARLSARAARADRRLRRLRRRHRRARPGGRRRPRARASARAARSRPRTPPPSARAATCSRSPTRTRSGRPTRCASSSRAFADPEVGYVCGQARFVDQGGSNQEGAYWRYELAIRGARVAPRPGSPPATARSTRCAARPTCRSGRASSHDLSFPFMLTKRGWRAVYAPRRGRRGEDGRHDRGRVRAQAADDARALVDEVVGDGMLSPRGYRPLYAFEIASHRVLRYAVAVAAPGRARRQHRPGRRVAALRGHARRPGCGAGRRGAGRRRARCAPLRLARYYVLVDRLDRRRTLGPDPARHPGRLGEGGGHPMSAAGPGCPASLDLTIAAVGLVRRLAGAARSPRSRSSSTRAGR